ncbi:MAG TPA: hypothetical protein VNQ99_10220 [Xanthobacteraceae bacterium]|nr:hypothetical protein [Xanthobacteraceae bacterium]
MIRRFGSASASSAPPRIAPAAGTQRSADPDLNDDAPAPSRALLPRGEPERIAAAPLSGLPAGRPSAGFLAHLIATAQQAPQTRRLRRASPEDAIGSYRAVARLADAARR